MGFGACLCPGCKNVTHFGRHHSACSWLWVHYLLLILSFVSGLRTDKEPTASSRLGLASNLDLLTLGIVIAPDFKATEHHPVNLDILEMTKLQLKSVEEIKIITLILKVIILSILVTDSPGHFKMQLISPMQIDLKGPTNYFWQSPFLKSFQSLPQDCSQPNCISFQWV